MRYHHGSVPPGDLGYPLFRKLLFRLDAETAHTAVLGLLRVGESLPFVLPVLHRGAVASDRLSQQLLGLEFPNPVGLAAGLDKNAKVLASMAALGFGGLEVGTVTPRPQPGNPRPRLFRHPSRESLQNSMGFNNAGGRALRRRLERRRPGGPPLGVNIGKNKSTPAPEWKRDYLSLLEELDGHCDYFAINVSSPNTPGLRDLQTEDALTGLLTEGREKTSTPLLVKLSPDLEPGRAAALAAAAVDAGAAGIILTNTTTDASLWPTANRQGGLSGRVLRERSRRALNEVAASLFGRCLLISVGGIDSAEEAYRRLRGGASLVQVYTALVYHGPGLAGRINRGLLKLLDRDGLASVSEAIGADLV